MNFVTFNGAISVISDLHNFDKSLNELLWLARIYDNPL